MERWREGWRVGRVEGGREGRVESGSERWTEMEMQKQMEYIDLRFLY